jgi:hypothetical protein
MVQFDYEHEKEILSMSVRPLSRWAQTLKLCSLFTKHNSMYIHTQITTKLDHIDNEQVGEQRTKST